MMLSYPKTAGFAPVVALILIGALGIGSVATVAAADKAGPGDALYPLDTTFENIRLKFTTSPEEEVEVRSQFAAERVEEIEDALRERGVEASGLKIALENLTAQKAAVADLVAQKQQLKARAKKLEDSFELKEERIEAAIRGAKRPLKRQKSRFEDLLEKAETTGDTAKASRLRTQITEIENKLAAFESDEEAAEAALEVEEERLEAQFDAEEKALEEREEAIERERELLEEAAEEAEDEETKVEETEDEETETSDRENSEKTENEGEKEEQAETTEENYIQ